MPQSALAFEPITALAARLRSGSLSPVALAESLLDRADALDGRLHSFVVVARERALAEARGPRTRLRGGQDLGPLHGIPYAAKDLYDVKGLPTTAGTRLLAENVAREDCPVVRQLAAAGMVLLGKTYTVQFAFGGVGLTTTRGIRTTRGTRRRTPPAALPAGARWRWRRGWCPMALGSDTGGSVRIPAALCGIVGLKTTVGRVGRAGVYPLSWTLDSVGPIARRVEDAASSSGRSRAGSRTRPRPGSRRKTCCRPSRRA